MFNLIKTGRIMFAVGPLYGLLCIVNKDLSWVVHLHDRKAWHQPISGIYLCRLAHDLYALYLV